MVHSFCLPSPNTDKEEFFDDFSVNLNKILGKYDNSYKYGNFISYKNQLSDMKDIFSLTNLITEPSSFKLQNSTLLDLILTNKTRCFMKY